MSDATPPPLAYAISTTLPLSPPIRWTLIIWPALVLLRHFLYWTMVVLGWFGFLRPTVGLSLGAPSSYFSMIAFVIEAVGLSFVLSGAILGRDGAPKAMRMLGSGSIIILCALGVSIMGSLADFITRFEVMSGQLATTHLWRIVSLMAASAPAMLALLTYRESKSPLNR